MHSQGAERKQSQPSHDESHLFALSGERVLRLGVPVRLTNPCRRPEPECPEVRRASISLAFSQDPTLWSLGTRTMRARLPRPAKRARERESRFWREERDWRKPEVMADPAPGHGRGQSSSLGAAIRPHWPTYTKPRQPSPPGPVFRARTLKFALFRLAPQARPFANCHGTPACQCTNSRTSDAPTSSRPIRS
jgi:hypothetical protein